MLVLVGASVPLWGPLSLRRVSHFAVRRVDVSGTRMLAPHEVLAASGIRSGQNVWNDPTDWESALRGHPVIEDARVSRRLPSTLLVRVRERQPAGLIDRGALQPVTADGTVLPIDPARAPLDLPLLRTRGLAPPVARSLVAESGRLASLDPGLWARVSEVHPAAPRGLALRVAESRAEVILPQGVDQLRLRQLRSTLDYLAGHVQRDSTAPVRVDLRWEDQIVFAPFKP